MKRKILYICIILLLFLMVLTGCGTKNDSNNVNGEIAKQENNENDNKNKIDTLEKQYSPIFSNGLALIKKDDLYGYIDLDGNIVVDFQYYDAQDFKNNFAVVQKQKNGEHTTLYKKGNEIIEYPFYVVSLEGELGKAISNEKYGYINKNMDVIIDFQYDMGSDFHDDRAVVRKDKNYFIIDETGNEIVDLKDWYAGDSYYFINYSDGIIPICINGEYMFIDKEGNVVSDSYELANNSKNGRAPVLKNGKVGFIDNTGKLVIDAIYDRKTMAKDHLRFDPFLNDYAAVCKDGKDGIIDKNGNIVVDFKYDFLTLESGIIYEAQNDGKKFYIDLNGNIYDDCFRSTDSDWCAVLKDGKWGYIDENGNAVTDFIYSEAYGFKEGYAKVTKDGKSGYIDEKENFIAFDSNITYVSDISEGFYMVKLNNKYGFLDAKTGNIVIEPIYNQIYLFNEGRAFVEKANQFAFINKKGKVVIGNLD